MSKKKHVEYLVVDTTAFIQNALLQEIGTNVVTVQEVVNEITSKRQLRRLVVLPYDLVVKDVFAENVQIVTEFAKKTGDYRSLSATDIKVMALTYQLEKEHVGIEHINTTPKVKKTINFGGNGVADKVPESKGAEVAGFYLPERRSLTNKPEAEEVEDVQEVLTQVEEEQVLPALEEEEEFISDDEDEDDEDESGWITPSNITAAKKQMAGQCLEEKDVKVACITTDFAMQNVLKQMNLQISALDGRVIREVRTFILRCYACFGLTSVMTKQFCPKCGNDTLKKVAVSVDENGAQRVHVNGRKPLTARGKKYSLPTFKGGKHSNNPILAEDQPRPDQRPTRLARTKNNPMDDDYIAGFSPFVMRDVNSKSAQLCIRPGQDVQVKHWMRKNPNEARRKRK